MLYPLSYDGWIKWFGVMGGAGDIGMLVGIGVGGEGRGDFIGREGDFGGSG